MFCFVIGKPFLRESWILFMVCPNTSNLIFVNIWNYMYWILININTNKYIIQLLLIKSFPEDISKYTLQFINIRLLAIWKIKTRNQSHSPSQKFSYFLNPAFPLGEGREVHRVLFFHGNVLFANQPYHWM
jgi:hypothetical protein